LPHSAPLHASAVAIVVSHIAWTPYDGKTATGWPVGTFVRGRKAMGDGEIVTPAQGAAVRFA
jgi:dihydroorotase